MARGEGEPIQGVGVMTSVPRAARALGISKDWLYQAVHAGEIQHIQFGRNVRIRYQDAADWVARKLAEGARLELRR